MLPMRMRLSRRTKVQVAAAAAVVLAFVVAFGPIVRTRVRAEAARRRIQVTIGSVRPAWLGVRLHNVSARPTDVQGLEARIDDVKIRFSLGLGPRRVELDGGVIEVEAADEEELRTKLKTWQESREGPSGTGHGPMAVIAIDGIGLKVRDGPTTEPYVDLRGISALRDDRGVRVTLSEGRAQIGHGAVRLLNGAADIDSAGLLTRARAAALLVQWTRSPEPPGANTANEGAVALLAPGSSPVASRVTRNHPRASLASAPAAPAPPLLPLPDLHAARARASILASVLADRVRQGADMGVDALTWEITRPRERVAFTLGPGPFSVVHSGSAFELRFTTDPAVATTPLSAELRLPTDGADIAASLAGGPISLSLLGIQEGAVGLVDVDRATAAGRARVVLAADASALTFDAEGATRDLSLSDLRLSNEVVRGVDLQLRARGTLSSAAGTGDLRVDELAATLGSIEVSAHGVLEQQTDHVAAAFSFEIPNASCQSLLDSIPTALLPTLQGMEMDGKFGAHGRFAFDTRSPDDLALDYAVGDRCRMVRVPAMIARERFSRPFAHAIYLPDGSLGEQTTGPGSPGWTPLDEISPYMQVAVLTTEDGGFPRHHGFNRASIRASIIANLKARRFVRGASTITMQLAKNLFLSRDKTLSRKLEELVLTDYLEQTFSKDELMELYLNVIEFGPAVYGITDAAEYYFGRSPAELNLAECLFLSSLLPAPLRYGAMRSKGEPPDSWMKMLHVLMEVAHRNGRIGDTELSEGESEPVVFWLGGERPTPRPAVRAHPRIDGETEDVTTTPP